MPLNYLVHHDGGGYIHVFAENEEDAIEQFYKALESILGHSLKICSCFGEPKPIDRESVVKPIKVELLTQRNQGTG